MNSIRKKTAIWNMIFQYYSVAITIASTIIIPKIYIDLIPLELLGAWYVTGNILGWMGLIDPGISQILSQQVAYYYSKKDFISVGSIVSLGLGLTVIIGIIFLVLGIILTAFIPEFVNISNSTEASQLKEAFLITVIGTVLMFCSFSLTAINQGLLSSIGTGIIFLISTLLRLFFVIYLLLNGYGIIALGIGFFILGAGLFTGNVLYLAVRLYIEKISFRNPLKAIKHLSGLTLTSFIAKIGSVASSQVDIFVVAKLVGPESAALLKFTKTAPETVSMFMTRPSNALMPSISHLKGEAGLFKQNLFFIKYTKFTIWAIFLFVGGVILFNKEFVSLWLGNSNYAGGITNILIAVSIMLNTISIIFGNFIFAGGRIKKKNLFDFAQAIIYIPMVILLTKYYGIAGCVLATIISLLTTRVWFFIYQFFKDINISKMQLVKIGNQLAYSLLSLIISFCIICYFDFKGWLELMLFSTLFVLLYIVSLLMLSQDFKETMKHLLFNQKRD